ncbi:hypothetical protein [Methanosarcina sp. 1.H.A.2.2]|uniref:hypothetical protein n=1 Tax=Methanosarcina sp. 1.H.A.2.2 TaxID=1483601 RepID=UPI00062260FB|nr:hypothetical protein [Methanosarcina sp. 1.H.A.2.2]KKH46814.1 hypothetical protein EO93_01890 [Methanosarcina sp. 1.H.A.2.2]
MKGAGAACKFLGIVFTLSLLVQGICAAETNNETNPNLNDTQAFEWVLLLPVFIGSLLFLCWMCRFFDRMNFCFVTFLLAAILLWLLSSNLISREIHQFFVYLIIILIGVVIIYESFFTQRKKRESKPIEWLFNIVNDIIVSFIAIFTAFMWPLVILYFIALLFRFLLLDNISRGIHQFIILLIIFFIGAVLITMFKKSSKKTGVSDQSNQNNIGGENNIIMELHDISRNFIIFSIILIWPMIIFLFYRNEVEYATFYWIESSKFPVYIIAASYIGVISYIFLSIEETFGHLIPEYKKISIAWSYLRRIIIAPYIAIIGFYLLNYLLNIDEFSEINDYFVFVFSFFAGVFTKTIEDWMYVWVQKLLPGDKKMEFNERTEYEVKESDLVTKLRLDEDLAYMLYNAKIRTIEELAGCSAEEIRTKINLDTRNLGEEMGCPVKKQEERLGDYSIDQIQRYINKAQEYLGIDKSELITIFNMDKELASKIYNFANIRTIEDLSSRNPKYICKRLKTCNEKVEEDEINDYIMKALCYMAINESDLVQELKMPRELALKISYKTKIDSIEKLKDKTADKIKEEMDKEFKEDVSEEEIKKYIGLAKEFSPKPS